jgi:hypothetical protein
VCGGKTFCLTTERPARLGSSPAGSGSYQKQKFLRQLVRPIFPFWDANAAKSGISVALSLHLHFSAGDVTAGMSHFPERTNESAERISGPSCPDLARRRGQGPLHAGIARGALLPLMDAKACRLPGSSGHCPDCQAWHKRARADPTPSSSPCLTVCEASRAEHNVAGEPSMSKLAFLPHGLKPGS